MDVLQVAFERAAFGSAWAPVAAFAAGIVTSFGPCVAPRFLAISGLVGHASPQRRMLLIGVFCGGLSGGYVAMAFAASLLLRVAQYTTLMYALLAVGLFAFGLRSLLIEEPECSHHHRCGTPSLIAVFTLGASFALVLSPCCTPIIATLAMLGAGTGSWSFTAAVLTAFVAGHAAPLVAAGFGVRRLTSWCERRSITAPVRVVSGALMVAMAGYYAVLA